MGDRNYEPSGRLLFSKVDDNPYFNKEVKLEMNFIREMGSDLFE